NIDNQNISAEKFKFNFNSNQIEIPENKIIVINSPFDIKGKITQYTKNPIADIYFKGKINSESTGKYLQKYIKEPYKALGSLKTDGKVSYKNETAEIKAQINADDKNYISYAVIKELLNKPSVLNIEGILKKEDLLIKDFSLYDGNIKPENKIISIFGNLQNTKDTELKNIKISIPKSISVSTDFLGGEDISLKADLNISGKIQNPKINGTAKIHNLKIKKLLTLVKNADLNFSDNIIKLSAPDVQVNTSNFNIYAEILPDIKNKITISNMQLNSYNLDVNSLFELLKNKENIVSQIKTEIKKGSATINNFEILDLKASDISTDFSFNNNILRIKDINATAYNGNITGNADYDIKGNSLHIMLNGSGADMKTSLYALCKLQDNISGTVNFKSDIKLNTGEYSSVIKSIKGDINFDSYNGKMGTLGKFEYYLYAQNIFYYGWLKANLNRIADTITKDNTAQYRKATGTLSFNDGYIITNDIKTKGDNMSLFIQGRHNILSNQSNFEILGRISDRISSKLGSFGEVSISDILNNNYNKKKLTIVPKEVIKNIPELYINKGQTNTFKVNIYGDIKSVSAVNSFVWILSKDNDTEEIQEPLPDFSEIPNE
ncbi:hypothetical protein II906_08630, partial [bacterium]|nr:hypothetical protein [bacterium]